MPRAPIFRPVVVTHRSLMALGVVAVLLALSTGVARGAEPDYEIEEDTTATLAGLSIYRVNLAQEQSFLEALVANGGYTGSQPGFANERVVRSLADGGSDTITYFVMTRHYSRAGMAETLEQRRKALYPYLTESSYYVPMTLAEHQVPDWGWERGSGVSFTRVVPDNGAALLEEYGTSLTFFKYGYTGQTAVVRAYSSATTLDEVRAALQVEEGLAGASIFQNPTDDSYLVYGEFFETPLSYRSGELKLASTGSSLSGTEIGVVVENYRAR